MAMGWRAESSPDTLRRGYATPKLFATNAEMTDGGADASGGEELRSGEET